MHQAFPHTTVQVLNDDGLGPVLWDGGVVILLEPPLARHPASARQAPHFLAAEGIHSEPGEHAKHH